MVILDKASENPSATIAAAERAKAAGIEILAVSVGKEVSDTEISAIASQPVEKYKLTLSDYSEEEVTSLQERYAEVICSGSGAQQTDDDDGEYKKMDTRALLQYLMEKRGLL